MAGGGFQVEGKGRKYEGGVTAFLVVTCLVAAFGGLIIGYDIGISGGVTSMDSFLSKFFPSVYQKEHENYHNENMYCKFNSHLLTLFTSSLYLAALVASLFASSVTRNLGRKVSMFVGGSVFLIGTILNGVAMNVSMLIIGRLLLGIGVGFTSQSIPIYLSEMPPANIRGALNIGFQMAITIGILAANLINYGTAKIHSGWAWRVSLSLAAVPATMITIGSFFLPDTPNSMIQRGHAEEAKRMLQKIRGTDNVEEEFRDLVDATEAAKEEENPWKSILQQRYRPQLTMCMLIPCFQQLTGINVIMFYAPVLFKTLGVGNDASLLSAVITGTVNVIATVVSIYCVDKFGRRILFLEGGIQMIICQIIVGVMIAINFGQAGQGSLSHGEADFVLFLICAYVAAFAWSWGPLAILVPSEIWPLEIRPAGQAINASVNLFFTFLIGQFFLTMLCHMKFGLFWFFGGFVVIMTIFIFFFLPETRKVPIEQMGNVWKAHWFWGKYIPDEVVGGKFSLGQRK